MNWRLNLVALAIYTMLGVSAGVAVVVIMGQWSRRAATAPYVADRSDSMRPPPAAHLDRTVESLPQLPEEAAGQSRDVRLLRTLLDERNAQLAELRQKLAAAEKRVSDLSQRYERMLAMMDEWIAMVDTMGDGDAALPPESATANATATPSSAEDPDSVQARAEDIRRELEMVNLELTAREEQLARVTEELIERRAMVETMARQLLGPVFESVQPRLQALLADERPQVRRWACEMLAAIGPSARDATAALQAMLAVETDPDVRAAADRALDAISD